MGAIAAARTTESSFVDFATSTNTPDLFVLDGFYNPAIGLNAGYNPALLRQIAHLPHVKKVESQVGINAGPLGKNDEPCRPSPRGSAQRAASTGSTSTRIASSSRRGGRPTPRGPTSSSWMPGRPSCSGYHLGQTVTIGWVSNAAGASQGASPNFKVPRDQQIRMKLVGIGATSVDSLFQDQDNASTDQIELFTPAFTRHLLTCCSNDMESGIALEGGTRYLSAVESEIRGILPKGLPFTYVQAPDVEARAERTLKPESIALGVFGGIAGLAALLIAGQLIGRRIRLNADDLDVLRAIGAGPAMTLSDGLIGTLGSIVLGLAVWPDWWRSGCRRSAPLGPVRPLLPVEAAGGLDGCSASASRSCSLASVRWPSSLAYRAAPHRVAARLQRERGSSVARAATATGLPADRGHGHPLRARTGGGPQHRAGSLRHPRCHPGRHRRGHHRHVRLQHEHPRLASRPLRVELDLRHGWWRRPRRHSRSPGRRPPRRRPLRGGLDRRLLLDAPDRRDERGGDGRDPPRRGRSSPALGTPIRRGPTRWCWAPPPWPNCTRGWATRSKWAVRGRPPPDSRSSGRRRCRRSASPAPPISRWGAARSCRTSSSHPVRAISSTCTVPGSECHFRPAQERSRPRERDWPRCRRSCTSSRSSRATAAPCSPCRGRPRYSTTARSERHRSCSVSHWRAVRSWRWA